jgi:hypothetical protein
MKKSPHIQDRLSVSLKDDDPIKLEQLRNALQARMKVRLSWAQVVRIAVSEQLERERS